MPAPIWLRGLAPWWVCLQLLAAGDLTDSPPYRVSFDQHPAGPYTQAMARNDWPGLEWAQLHQRGTITQDPDTMRDKVLKVVYPEGAFGPEDGGIQFLVSLRPADELWLSYWVKFETGFDFRRGGKLPGLTSHGAKYSGGVIPEAGDGWSARYMWRQEGTAEIYFYYVDMPGPWGESLPLRTKFKPSHWHHLVQRIRINTPGKSDGSLEVWIDGKQLMSQTDIRFRKGKQGRIDSFYFSTFHGGNTRDWAPNHTCHAFFDDFRISTAPPPGLRQTER